jgi:hypothetical protein
MKTFNKIVCKVVNLDNNIFSFNYNKNDKISGIYKFFFGIFTSVDTEINKFDYIQQTVNNFYFLDKATEKKEFFDLFCKIQRIYHSLNKFVFLCKFKKAKLIVETDLQLNSINKNEPNVICIYHINSKYLFKIEELLKHIYMSLTNCFSFFSEPIAIKNPYNNIAFDKSVLYFINYYIVSNVKINYIKFSHIDIFIKFKECNFNMTKFVTNYEHILIEYAIKNYLNNCTRETIVNEIKKIIQTFNYYFCGEIQIKISEGFPEDELVRIMKPYLYLKLQSSYSLIPRNKTIARKKLMKKLLEFQRFNPQFGRKIIRFKDIYKDGKIKRIKSHIEFNMKHKKFNTDEEVNFMNNHLSYKYDSYEVEDAVEDYSEEHSEEISEELSEEHSEYSQVLSFGPVRHAVVTNSESNYQNENNITNDAGYEEDEEGYEDEEYNEPNEYNEEENENFFEEYDNDSIS